MPEREPLPPYFDPCYQSIPEELAGESWAVCYGRSSVLLPPEPEEQSS